MNVSWDDSATPELPLIQRINELEKENARLKELLRRAKVRTLEEYATRKNGEG